MSQELVDMTGVRCWY